MILPVTSGDLRGPGITGTIQPMSGDWLLVRPDGVGELKRARHARDARWRADLRDLRRLRHQRPGADAALAAGRGDPARPRTRSSRRRFSETSAPAYAWLQQSVVIGSRHARCRGVSTSCTSSTPDARTPRARYANGRDPDRSPPVHLVTCRAVRRLRRAVARGGDVRRAQRRLTSGTRMSRCAITSARWLAGYVVLAGRAAARLARRPVAHRRAGLNTRKASPPIGLSRRSSTKARVIARSNWSWSKPGASTSRPPQVTGHRRHRRFRVRLETGVRAGARG